MALTPGNYALTVKGEGYEDYNFIMSIVDVPSHPEKRQDFQLSKETQTK
jgi:hypothetical protein